MTSPSERQAEADDNARRAAAYDAREEALLDAPLELNRLLGRVATALERLAAIQGGLAMAHHNRREQDQ